MGLDAKDYVPETDVQRSYRQAVLLAIRLGPWAPVRAGLSKVPLTIIHCAHCDRYNGENLWNHRSCLAVEMEPEMEINTAKEFTDFLRRILDVGADDNADWDLWQKLEFGPNIVNNIAVTCPNGKQYVISVKAVK